MGDKNFVNYKQEDAADALTWTRRSVSRHLKDLERAEVIVYGRGWCQLNPNIVWYGASESERAVAVNIFYQKRYKKNTARHYGETKEEEGR